MSDPPHGPPEITEAQQAATAIEAVGSPTPDNVSRAVQNYSPGAVAAAAASIGASGATGDVGGGPQWSTATLSSAQILALTTASVEIVPAPGAGKMLVPLSGWVHYRPGEIPYLGDAADMGLAYGSFIPPLEGSTPTQFWSMAALRTPEMIASDWLTATVPMIGVFSTSILFSYFDESEVENAPLTFGMGNVFDVLEGDGTITVSVLCSTITLDDLGA